MGGNTTTVVPGDASSPMSWFRSLVSGIIACSFADWFTHPPPLEFLPCSSASEFGVTPTIQAKRYPSPEVKAADWVLPPPSPVLFCNSDSDYSVLVGKPCKNTCIA